VSDGERSKGLRPGKLPPALLAELLGQLPTQDADLVLGPAVGEDAAVIEFAHSSARLLVAKCDPITFATDQIGFYAVHVCANDLAVTGATPRFFLPTLLLPAVGLRSSWPNSSLHRSVLPAGRWGSWSPAGTAR